MLKHYICLGKSVVDLGLVQLLGIYSVAKSCQYSLLLLVCGPFVMEPHPFACSG